MALRFFETVQSGKRAEQVVIDTLKQYSKHTYNNIRIPTLYNQGGSTEVDVVSAIDDVIIVVEVKNIRSIVGSADDTFWKMRGFENGEEYSAINILMQNRIHVRALKNKWYELRGEFPPVVSLVVVPNSCEIPQSLEDAGIETVEGFLLALQDVVSSGGQIPQLGYALDFFVGSL